MLTITGEEHVRAYGYGHQLGYVVGDGVQPSRRRGTGGAHLRRSRDHGTRYFATYTLCVTVSTLLFGQLIAGKVVTDNCVRLALL